MTDEKREQMRDIINKSPLLRQVELLLFKNDTERFLNAVQLLTEQILATTERRARIWSQSKITGNTTCGLFGPESFAIRARDEALRWAPDNDYWLEYEDSPCKD